MKRFYTVKFTDTRVLCYRVKARNENEAREMGEQRLIRGDRADGLFLSKPEFREIC
jgi:hypothetical protein